MSRNENFEDFSKKEKNGKKLILNEIDILYFFEFSKNENEIKFFLIRKKNDDFFLTTEKFVKKKFNFFFEEENYFFDLNFENKKISLFFQTNKYRYSINKFCVNNFDL